MKQVQNALRDIGIPVMAGVWRATSPNQNPPQQYVVYSTTKTESSHFDDHVSAVRTFVYQRRAARMEGISVHLVFAKHNIWRCHRLLRDSECKYR